MHSRHLQPLLVRRLATLGLTCPVGLRIIALATMACVLAPMSRLHAQRVDGAQVGARRTAADTTRRPPGDSTRRTAGDSTRNAIPKPPLSPRRAFLYSLALPGYSQSVLNRPTAGALFVMTESIALVMLRESSAELRQARRFETDSLVVIGVDPTSGANITQVSAYTQRLIDVRRSHVEDWIAFILANHLFAAADAYVAAHLWDLPTQISVESRPAGPIVAARLRW